MRGRGGSLCRLLASSGLIGILWIIAASRWIATDTVVPWDSKNQFYAFFRFLASALQSGASPFWNPYHYGGHPSVADPQSLIFAPAFFLWALFDPAPSLRTFDLLVYGHLLVGGLAVGAIGWRARWPVAACVLAAAVFMFGGAAAGRLQHTGMIISYGLFPPALLLLQLALERRSIVIGAAFAAVASALALERNQVALLLSFVLVAVALGEIVSAGRPLRYLRERLAVLAVMAAIGSALVVAPLLLTMQFAALSNRPDVLLDTALKGSLYPAHLAQLAVADIYGVQSEFWGPGPGSIPDIANTDDSFNYMFVGSAPVVLLLWFGLLGGQAFRPGRRVLTGAITLALLYAMGRYTPLFSWAFEWFPGVNKFRRPVDADFVLVAALALLCGHVLADYVREGLPRRRVAASIVTAAGGVAILAWAVIFMARSGHGMAALHAVLQTAPIGLGAILVLALARAARARTVAAAVVALVAVADLMWWNVAFRLNAERRLNYAVLDQPKPADAKVLELVERLVRERQAVGERPRIEIMGMGGPWQNVAVVRGLEAINGYNPLRIGFYDRLVSPGESNWQVDLRSFPASFDGYDCALARALGLEFVVLDRPIEQMRHLARLPVADMLQDGPEVWVYRLRDASPRLTFATRIQVADADAVGGSGQLLLSPSPDRVLIDDDTPPSRRYDFAQGASAGRARIVSWSLDRIEIEADSQLGGMLALHDTYYPGWIAEIDGMRAPILRADVLFRGLELPPGAHRVVFRFAPFSVDNLRDALRLVLHRPQ
ncbi:MAG: hypothetical protein QOI12_144 [Alphaproteobacteria bacterium]|nr:hypothetical protein [Alphaproteobacteria bacterium]